MNNKLGNRVIVSFIGSLLKSGINFVTSIIVARLLGPDDTGRMFFLLLSFQSFLNLIDLNTSQAFFTFTAKITQSRFHILSYFIWFILQLLISLLFIGLILPGEILDILWLGESKAIIILALIASFMQGRFWTVASRLAEASRETFKLQCVSLIFTLLHLLFILIFYLFNKICLEYIFIAITVEWFLAGIIVSSFYKYDDLSKINLSVSSLLKSYFVYCLPLFPLGLINFTHGFTEKWMLQNWGGAVEQGYYGVCLKITSVGLLVSTCFINIFWKEIAELKSNGNIDEMLNFFNNSCKVLFILSSICVCAIIPWADFLINSLLGSNYQPASITLMVLLLYPTFQVLGQLTGSFMLAVEATVANSIIGSIFCCSSIIFTYFMLAPKDSAIPGLSMGSFGLAISTVALNIILVNFNLFFLNKRFSSKYSFIINLYLIAFIVISFTVKLFITSILNNDTLSFIFSIILYLFVLLGISHYRYGVQNIFNYFRKYFTLA